MTREEALENTPTVDTTTKRTDKHTETHGVCLDDFIKRTDAIDALNEYFTRIGKLKRRGLTKGEKAISLDTVGTIKTLPSAQPEIIHCYDCIYYDPEHIEKNGVRYEYEDMPKAAFDILGTGLVNSKYGINVGGRCCRDYNVGYPEDKRVFVPKTNYCGRAERRNDERTD